MQRPALNYQQRALLFRRLASLQQAGIDIIKALNSLAAAKEHHLAQTSTKTAQKIQQGMPLSQAALATGLFDKLESRLLEATQHTGRTDILYKTLAANYEQKAKRLHLLKARLMLPAGLMLLAGFIAPLPKLILGDMNAAEYIFTGGGFALIVLFVFAVLLRLPVWLNSSTQNKHFTTQMLDRALLLLPVIRPWYIRKHTCQWLEMVALMYASGISLLEAMPLINASISSPRIRQSFETVEQRLQTGETFFNAVSGNPYLATETKHLINSAEAAGRLEELLQHSTKLEKQRLKLQEQQLAEWLPRWVYVFVLVWLTNAIFTL